MTIEGAIVDLQNLIDNEGIPFWAKPSLQKVMETVEAERERYIKERKTGKWVRLESGSDGCNQCWTNDFGWARFNYCPHCGAKMEGADNEDSD